MQIQGSTPILTLIIYLIFSANINASTETSYKVFILAGQSNMAGSAPIALDKASHNYGKGNLVWSMQHSQSAELMTHLKQPNGEWTIRDDVWISYKLEDRVKRGKLGPGYSRYNGDHIGPELQFGHVVGDYFEEPVILIKTAWGGKSLFKDFRPPSSSGATGSYYTQMIDEVRETLANLNKASYEIAGFIWMQGWNDMGSDEATQEYAQNLINLAQDIRAEFGNPILPFIVGELGNTSKVAFIDIQREATSKIENSYFVETASFMRAPSLSPAPNHSHHWYANAESYFLIGDALAKGALAVLEGGGNQLGKSRPSAKLDTPISYTIKSGRITGYDQIRVEKAPMDYGGGFSMRTAVWPLLEKYPGNNFQTGLYHTWMFPQHDKSVKALKKYSCIEGGLGWWRDTRFPTETPKFIMGAVALGFSGWANGPGAGKGRDWEKPKGKYAIVQLSSRVLWPPDGLNLKQGASGELFGYGYRPLPLIEARNTTDSQDVPTGDQCWTLFLDTKNAKGPISFVLPEFFSRPTIETRPLVGQFLDAKPSSPNRSLSMETQYIPALIANGSNGISYAKVSQILYPESNDQSVIPLISDVTAYKKEPHWQSVDNWLKGGPIVPTRFDKEAVFIHDLEHAGSSWSIFGKSTLKEDRRPIDWNLLHEPFYQNEHTFAYSWKPEFTKQATKNDKPVTQLPTYFRLDNLDKKTRWVPIEAKDVPKATGLLDTKIEPHLKKDRGPYITPETEESVWKTPGPTSGPHQIDLGDGSTLTYYWYRFADQPAILKTNLSFSERETLQNKVEEIHRHWTLKKTYLPTSSVSTPLASLDPALIVTPPDGLEVGYVPIVTRQETTK